MTKTISYMYRCDGCGQTLVANHEHNIRRVSCGTCKEKRRAENARYAASISYQKGA